MTIWKEYTLAHSITEAIEALGAAPGPARIIAGGTDLLLDLQQGRHPPLHTLVDVTAIPEMNRLEIRPEGLYIGAALPLRRIIESSLVREQAPGLVEACGLIGGPQVRNSATLGGNVGHALPAGDGTIALMALDAQAEIASPAGTRCISLAELFRGPGQNTLEAKSELIAGFFLPLRRNGESSAFRRVMRPQGVAIAILNMAVWVQRKGELVDNLRIALGPAGPTPRRARQAEDALRGCLPDPESLAVATAALLAEARFRTSPHRSTEAYRRRIAGALLQETFTAAWERAA